MRKFLACIGVLSIVVGATSPALAGPEPDSTILRVVREYRNTTWHYESVMGTPRTPFRIAADVFALRTRWRTTEQRTLRVFRTGPAHRRQWLCIHHFEGSWRDPNPPYYGGLQMDISFQRAYGPLLLRIKGTANHWTPLEQMWVAERAYRTRGFYPWPNTARDCGLI